MPAPVPLIPVSHTCFIPLVRRRQDSLDIPSVYSSLPRTTISPSSALSPLLISSSLSHVQSYKNTLPLTLRLSLLRTIAHAAWYNNARTILFSFLIKVTHFIHSYKYSSWENTNSRRLLYSCAIAHTLIRDVCPYANSPCFSAALFQRLKINLSLLKSNPIHRPVPCIRTSINSFIKKVQLLYKRVYRARIAHLYITEFVLQTRALKQRRYFRRCFRAYLLVL